MKCPHCGHELHKDKNKAEGVWDCSKCKGVFFVLVISQGMKDSDLKKRGKETSRISGCEWLKYKFWNGELCTDEEEFFNNAGDRVCRMRKDAILKNEPQIADLQAVNRELLLDVKMYKEFFVHKDRLSDLQMGVVVND